MRSLRFSPICATSIYCIVARRRQRTRCRTGQELARSRIRAVAPSCNGRRRRDAPTGRQWTRYANKLAGPWETRRGWCLIGCRSRIGYELVRPRKSWCRRGCRRSWCDELACTRESRCNGRLARRPAGWRHIRAHWACRDELTGPRESRCETWTYSTIHRLASKLTRPWERRYRRCPVSWWRCRRDRCRLYTGGIDLGRR